jgi:hypothetical protein
MCSHRFPLFGTIFRPSESWYSGSLLQQSFYMQGCGILETRNDLYDCDPAKPYQQCKEDSQCPSGQLCGEGMAPRMCVECRTSISNTWFEQVNVTTNVTASLLAGKFWGKDEFYNHTGVDLIVTEYVFCDQLDHIYMIIVFLHVPVTDIDRYSQFLF